MAVLTYNAERAKEAAGKLLPRGTKAVVRITGVETGEDKNGDTKLAIGGVVIRPVQYEGEGFFAIHAVNDAKKGPYYTGVFKLLEALGYDVSGEVEFDTDDWTDELVGAVVVKHEEFEGETRTRWGKYFHPDLFESVDVSKAEAEAEAEAAEAEEPAEGPRGRGRR